MSPSNEPCGQIGCRAIALAVLALIVVILLAGWMDRQDAAVDEQYRCEHGIAGRDGPARLACDEG